MKLSEERVKRATEEAPKKILEDEYQKEEEFEVPPL